MRHISLDTARRLRASGFGQEGCAFYWVARVSGFPVGDETWRVETETPSRLHLDAGSMTQRIACPNSDELLAAMKFRGKAMLDGPSVDITAPWLACYEGWHGGYTEGIGTTPAEALAALWLELKAKEAKDAQTPEAK